ncbi:hypothetical protein U1Q18_009635 [Sarracenia purpurea var. burkii]
MAEVGVGVDEFGRECCVLMEAMEDEAGVDLVEIERVFAEVQEGRGRVWWLILGGDEEFEFGIGREGLDEKF